MHGYTDQILRVNLDKGSTKKKSTGRDLARAFLGGRGFIAKTLFDELTPSIDPLSPQNILIFATGPLTGCPVPGANRIAVGTKSPLTKLFLDTYAGAYFAPELKFAGYDALIVEGRGEKPVYISIEDDSVAVKDAAHIWGKDCWEAETILKQEIGDIEARVVVVGPAGENLVKYSVISTDYYHQCGRGGAGTVMGSKNLKGVVVRGTKGLAVRNFNELLEYVNTEIVPQLNTFELARARTKYGTALVVDLTQTLGIIPTRNYQLSQFDEYEKIDAYAMRRKNVVADKSCFGCCVGCCKFSLAKTGPYKGTKIGGPEYETIVMGGSNLGVGNLEYLIEYNALCDRLGLDTISTGNVIGFLMECYERGLVTSDELGGLDLTFGSTEPIMQMLQKIASREGMGDIAAEGVKATAEKIGKGSEKFAMQTKGMEYPAYDPRGAPSMALFYAVNERGGCHRRGWPLILEQKLKPYVTEGRAELVKSLYDQRVLLHAAGVCDFPYAFGGFEDHGLKEITRILSIVTGRDLSESDSLTISERITATARSFNVREGTDRRDDILAYHIMEKPIPSGPAKNQRITREMLDAMLDEYYELRDWDIETGIPKRETLEKLDLGDIARSLESYVKKAKGKLKAK